MEEVYIVLVVIGAFLLNLERFVSILERLNNLTKSKKDSSHPPK